LWPPLLLLGTSPLPVVQGQSWGTCDSTLHATSFSKQATCPNAAMATASRFLRSPGPRCPPPISTGGGSDLRRQQPHRPGLKWMNHAFNRGNARGPTSTCDRKLRLRQPWWRQWRAAPTVDIVLRGPWTPALNSLRLGVYLRLNRRQAKAAAQSQPPNQHMNNNVTDKAVQGWAALRCCMSKPLCPTNRLGRLKEPPAEPCCAVAWRVSRTSRPAPCLSYCGNWSGVPCDHNSALPSVTL
jgi:hypothetical protein